MYVRETKLANNCECDIAGAENDSYNVCIAIYSYDNMQIIKLVGLFICNYIYLANIL